MTTPTPLLSRRMALGAIAGSALLSALPAVAEERLTDVRVIDRDRDRVLPVYRFRGEFWIAGEPGARYAVELVNDSRERLLNVVSVDGVNVITGETAAFDQAGYVLEPMQRYEVAGWRKSRREIAAFEFTRHSRSYAARTGRPDDVGVIGVAVFREREAFALPHPPLPPFPPFPPFAHRSPMPAPAPRSRRSPTAAARLVRSWARATVGASATGSAKPISYGAAAGRTRSCASATTAATTWSPWA
jgi:hypothetical protein